MSILRAKIKLLLKLKEGFDTSSVQPLLRFELDRLNSRLKEKPTICVGKALADPSIHVIAAGAFDASFGHFDVMLEIIPEESEIDEAVMLLAGIGGRLDAIVDVENSAALVGVEHVVLPGEGGVLVLIANRRLPHLDHQQFIDYWFGFHADFTRTHTPPEIGMRYRQFHTDQAKTATLVACSGLKVGDFDGAAECYYADEAKLRSLMAISEIVDEATEDEVKFVDHCGCVTTVFVPSNSINDL